MELEFETRTSEFWESVVQECLPQEETAELIVPDSFPDMERIVDSWAEVLLRSKECRSGSVSISGAIQAGLLFLAEGEEQPRKLDCYIPFSARLERPELTQDCFVEFTGHVKSVDGRMLNSRKAMLRVNLLSDLSVWQKRQQEVPVLKEEQEDLQLLRREYPVLRTFDTAERPFVLQEELELPEAESAAAELLSWSARPQLQEVKGLGRRIAFRGAMDLELLYRTQEGALHTWQTSVPFTQYAEMNSELDEAELAVTLCATGRELELSEQGRRLYLNMSLLAQCRALQRQELTLLEDLYSTSRSVTPKFQTLQVSACLDARVLQQTLRQTVPIQAERVEQARLYADQPAISWQDGALQVTVPLQLQLLARDETGALQQMSGHLSAPFTLEAAENCRLCAYAQAHELYVVPTAGGVELRCQVEVQAEVWGRQEFQCVCGADCAEKPADPDRPSVIIRRMAEGESLWGIAKACGTTVAQLCAANALEEKQASAGVLLLIPMA